MYRKISLSPEPGLGMCQDIYSSPAMTDPKNPEYKQVLVHAIIVSDCCNTFYQIGACTTSTEVDATNVSMSRSKHGNSSATK